MRSLRFLPLIFCALACRREQPPVRIGVLATLTGTRSETSGQPTLEAAQLMERQVNAKGGVLVGNARRKLVLDVRDIGDDAEGATRAAQIMINQDSVVAIIGPQFSVNAIPVANLAENAQMPMISPMSSHPRTTEGKHF